MRTPRSTATMRWFVVVAVVAAVAAAAAGCGGEDETAATETPTATDASQPAATTATDTQTADTDIASADTAPAADTGSATATDVTDYVAYFGGNDTPADASLSPIVVGWVNQQGGPFGPGPSPTVGADAAVEFINAHGGIGGHPLELQTCFIAQAEEEGQKCGQEFANNPDLVAVAVGATAVGSQSLYSTLAGSKAVTVAVALSAVDAAQPNAGVFYGDVEYVLAPLATFARDVMGAESAALVYPEGVGFDAAAQGIEAAFELAGIPLESVGFAPNTTDLTPALSAAGAEAADVVIPLTNPNDCVNVANALDQAGIAGEKVLANPVCLNPDVLEALGDFPQWTYLTAESLATDPTDPDVPPYLEILQAQGLDEYATDELAILGFGSVLTLARFLNALGPDDITTEGILEQMKSFSGPLVLGSPVINCGQYPEAPAVCNDRSQFYRYDGNFQFTKVADWLPPPEGWAAP